MDLDVEYGGLTQFHKLGCSCRNDGHGDVKFADYVLDLYPMDSNHTIGSLALLLRDLQKLHAYSSRSLFENVMLTYLYEVVLDGKGACLDSLQESPNEHVIAKTSPSTQHVQLDNGSKDNENTFVLAY